MEIIIDTEKKTITVPQEFKKGYDARTKTNKMMGIQEDSILSMLNVKDFTVVAKKTRQVSDTITAKYINDFMTKLKDSDSKKYEEYITLKNTVVGRSKKGKELYTNFLSIKKWFYANYPEQCPFKKKEKK